MTTSFIATIAQETGQSEKDARQRLDAFCSHIRAVLELEGRCLVEGLGEFEQTPERIRFRPAEELVNVLKTVSPVLPDYAVPTPAGITPPVSTSAGSAPAPDREAARPVERTKSDPGTDLPAHPEEQPQGQDWTIDRDPIVTRRVSSSLDPETGKPTSESREKSSSSEKAPAPTKSSASDKSAPLPVVGPTSDTGSKIPAEPADKKGDKKPAPRLPARSVAKTRGGRTSRRAPGRQDSSSSGRTSLIILGSAVILILAVVAVTQFGLWPDSASDGPDITQNDPLVDNSGDVLTGDMAGGTAESLAADSTEALATPPASETTPLDPAAEPTTEEVEQETPAPVSYSLDTSMVGYTVVVGSSVSRSDADATMLQYSDLGMPYGVLEYQEDGLTRYRLGVGLFSTVQAADSVREAIPDQLPEGAWVFRIR